MCLYSVMGATGSGKTTVRQSPFLCIPVVDRSKLQFINLVSGSNLRVGRGLKSCTNIVQMAVPFEIDGRSITLIDTPGFDDTTRSDTDILKMIAGFLQTS
jgi:predicted GTPase